MDWVFPPKWHDFFWKKIFFIFIIFICLASQFKSQYTVWTECSPQNDIIFFEKKYYLFLLFFTIHYIFTIQLLIFACRW